MTDEFMEVVKKSLCRSYDAGFEAGVADQQEKLKQQTIERLVNVFEWAYQHQLSPSDLNDLAQLIEPNPDNLGPAVEEWIRRTNGLD